MTIAYSESMHLKAKIAILIASLIPLFAKGSQEGFPPSFPIDANTLVARLDSFYSPLDDWREFIQVDADRQRVKMDPAGPWIALQPVNAETSQAFANIAVPHVALDPGHIGGAWGMIEHRHFRVGDGPVFQEGDAVLSISKRVRELLADFPIRISLIRENSEPLNPLRAEDYLEEARAWAKQRFDGDDVSRLEIQKAIQARADLLFYRSGEIRERARIVNEKIQPDLVVCLHINATSWDDPTNPSLKEGNNLHILVHGNYTPGELDSLSSRQELAHKIAHRTYELELRAAQAFLKVFRRTTHLPAYIYEGDNALRLDDAGYIWARNLAANRLYRAPVVFLEPYVANSIEGYARIEAGDYQGRKMVAGRMRLSLYEEYARSVASALISLFDLKREKPGT